MTCVSVLDLFKGGLERGLSDLDLEASRAFCAFPMNCVPVPGPAAGRARHVYLVGE